MKQTRIQIGIRLKQARQAAAMTQQQVADKLKVTRQQVSKWERGTSLPTSEQWFVVGRLYAASLDYLVYGIHTMPVELHAIMQKSMPVKQSA